MKNSLSITIFIVTITVLTVYGQTISNPKTNTVTQQLVKDQDIKSDTVIKIDEPIGHQNLTTNQGAYMQAEQLPQFKEGWEKFYKFIDDNLIYPKEMKDNNIQFRVLVTFVVDTDGSLFNIRVAKPYGYGADEEAIRLMTLSPKWIPGLINDKRVKVQMTIPIIFKLSK